MELDFHGPRTHETAPVGGFRGHLAAVDLDAFADADEPVPVASTEAVARRGTDAVVAYLGSQAVGSVAHGHVGVAGAGVLERVGQALLNDPVGRQVDRRRERERLAVDVQPDGQAGPADLVQQGAEGVEAGLGHQVDVVLVAAHGGQQTAHLGQRRAPGLLDAAERIAVLGERVGSLCLTAATWSTITLTAWATMS